MIGDADVIEQSGQPLSLVRPLCSADTVIGRARRPRLSDRSQLPYLEAFILETFRHSSFVPFTIPHRWRLPIVPSHLWSHCHVFSPASQPWPWSDLSISFLAMTPDSSQTLASTLPPSSPNMIKVPGSQEKNHTSDLSSHSPLLTFPPYRYSQPRQAGLTIPYKHEPASLQFCLCWTFCLEGLQSSLATRILSYLILTQTSPPLEAFLDSSSWHNFLLIFCRTYSHLSLIRSWDFNNVKRVSEHLLQPIFWSSYTQRKRPDASAKVGTPQDWPRLPASWLQRMAKGTAGYKEKFSKHLLKNRIWERGRIISTLPCSWYCLLVYSIETMVDRLLEWGGGARTSAGGYKLGVWD